MVYLTNEYMNGLFWPVVTAGFRIDMMFFSETNLQLFYIYSKALQKCLSHHLSEFPVVYPKIMLSTKPHVFKRLCKLCTKKKHLNHGLYEIT